MEQIAVYRTLQWEEHTAQKTEVSLLLLSTLPGCIRYRQDLWAQQAVSPLSLLFFSLQVVDHECCKLSSLTWCALCGDGRWGSLPWPTGHAICCQSSAEHLMAPSHEYHSALALTTGEDKHYLHNSCKAMAHNAKIMDINQEFKWMLGSHVDLYCL